MVAGKAQEIHRNVAIAHREDTLLPDDAGSFHLSPWSYHAAVSAYRETSAAAHSARRRLYSFVRRPLWQHAALHLVQ